MTTTSTVTFNRCAGERERRAAAAIERVVWAPYNWEAEGSVGVPHDPELHVVGHDAAGTMVATADACPMAWDGSTTGLPDGGWTAVVVAAARRTWPQQPTWACALGTSVVADGRGLGAAALIALRDRAWAAGYVGLLAPARPTALGDAWQYEPGLTIGTYASRRRPDGSHIDPWLRLHERVGGRIIGTCATSARFAGSRQQWERWTATDLPDDGVAFPPRTAGPLHLVAGHGVLVEPSVWVLHAAP